MKLEQLYKEKMLILKPTFIEIRHGYYGCETGCCGSELVLVNEQGEDVYEFGFEFGHCYESRIEEAKYIAEQLSIEFRHSKENQENVNHCWEG